MFCALLVNDTKIIIMSLPPPGEWSSLSVTGQVFPPCTFFTLTTVGEKKAALYGGWDELRRFNHLFIVELGRHSVVSSVQSLIPVGHVTVQL